MVSDNFCSENALLERSGSARHDTSEPAPSKQPKGVPANSLPVLSENRTLCELLEPGRWERLHQTRDPAPQFVEKLEQALERVCVGRAVARFCRLMCFPAPA